MKADYDKSLFFLVLAMVCVWLIIDYAVGKKYLLRFLSTLFPFIDNEGPAELTDSKGNTVKTENRNDSIGVAQATSDKEKQMQQDDPNLFYYYKNNMIPYSPYMQSKLEAYKKKWGVS